MVSGGTVWPIWGRAEASDELVKAMSSFLFLESNSSKSTLVPDKKVFAFADLVYSILSKNASSGNLPASGCSPDIAKSMIDGGMVQGLTGILQVIDLDHPAPKIVNLLLKALESLTRAANASEQVLKSEGLNKKKTIGSNGRPDDQTTTSASEAVEHNQNSGLAEVPNGEETEERSQVPNQNEGNHDAHPHQSAPQDMRIEVEETMANNPPMEIGMDFMREEMEEEVRWREAFDGLDHLQVLGQPGAASNLIDVAAEPFEGVNVDDLFGLPRPLGFERRRQSVRPSFERSVTEANGLQHPLLLRPSQSGDPVSMWSSGGHSSRDLEALSAGSFDVAHFYMFDAPVLPYDHVSSSLFGDRLGSAVPPSLTDYSVGMDSLQIQGRRGPGDGRWTDDGRLQASTQGAVIAQAVEEMFLSQLRSLTPASGHAERQSNHSGVQESQPANDPPSNGGQVVLGGDNIAVSKLKFSGKKMVMK
ncbi:hypothetical protein GH714_006675 [Hevea brasiliensis]|uniref:Uncharacterized protein n=1 Tax=Hevea brasiliensis TaxID=3981 RepID=A0A6A6M0V3_HEVBR|nr:hypothetical protein GH714_006675 [Hevea brasiliensis]